MRKSYIYILLVFALTPIFVEAQKADRAQPLYMQGLECISNYQFADANEFLTTYLQQTNGQNPTMMADAQAAIQRASIGEKLLNHVHDVEILDSTTVSEEKVLKAIAWTKDMGTMTQVGSSFTYENPRHDRRYLPVSRGGVLTLAVQEFLLAEWASAHLLPSPLTNVEDPSVQQNYPFLMGDGVTLYFAQTGPESLGGYDIFYSKYNSRADTWTRPENVGMPFNSEANDYLLAVDEMTGKGWFVSDRNCKEGFARVYSFIYKESYENKDMKTQEALIAYAKLQSFVKAKPTAIMLAAQRATPESYDFSVFITDGVVYHSESDFQSPHALEMFRSYRQAMSELEEKERRLDADRDHYSSVHDLAERQSLSKEILELEDEIADLQVVTRQKLLLLRELETTGE